jgi:hypothetical protein
MVILLCWIIGAVFVGKYASHKGLSGVSFFVISLFASPLVGLLLALVSSPDREKAAHRAGLKKCPECAEAIKTRGTSLPPLQAQAFGRPPWDRRRIVAI